MDQKIFNVSSNKQSGGITSGIINNKNEINNYIWKGRKQGFFLALAMAILVEIIIRLIF